MEVGIGYYTFAFFIAVLVCIIAVLVKILFGSVKQQRKLLDEKEKSLLQLYQTVESVMDDFNTQIETAMDDIKEYENRAAAYRAAHAMLTSVELTPKIVEDAAKPPDLPKPLKPEALSREGNAESSVIRAASEALERAERLMKAGDSGQRVDFVVDDDNVAGSIDSVASESGAPLGTDSGSIISSITGGGTAGKGSGAGGSKSTGTGNSSSRSRSSGKGKSSGKTTVKSDNHSAGGGVVIQRLFDDTAVQELAGASDVQSQRSRSEMIHALSEEGKNQAQIAKELGITQNEVKLVLELGIRK